jgi:hypothetical protein
VTPCSFYTIRSRRGNREWTRVSVWVAISAGVKRTWRVEAPRDVTASKRLLFYLFVFVWMALSAELLRKGRSGIEWPDLGFLELEGAGSVCEGI